jgi:hypothetical protein
VPQLRELKCIKKFKKFLIQINREVLMLENKKNTKTFFTIVIAAVVIMLGLMGASWQISFAETIPTIPTLPTVPTIPIVYEIDPSTVEVNSPDTEFTLTGTSFIDTEYTMLRWIGPDNVVFDVFPDSVSADGTTLVVTIPAARLMTIGKANIWVINHPEEFERMEISGPYSVAIVETHYIYLSLVLK